MLTLFHKKSFFIFGLLCLFFTASDAQVDLNRGLVAYYPFNGNANDVTGNGLNGFLRNGVQLTTDKFGNPNSAYLFDGIDDYIEIPDDPKLRFRDSFSVCISFMKLSQPGGNLIEKRDVLDGTKSSFDIAAGSGGADGAVKTDNDCNDANAFDYTGFAPAPATGQWYCIVLTFKSGTLNFYQDGILISSTTTFDTKMDSCSGSNIRIGYHLAPDPIWMHGKIDEVRLYNRAINQQEVSALCDQPAPDLCTSWLKIPNYSTTDYVSIGDLDVTGNTITVEALFNADTNYFIPSTISYDLVSKHTGPSDCNYLLRPVTAEITTTNGFFQIVACDYVPKKINHVALVYNGTTLKFYRNGYLMGSKPATGNLVTNNLLTKIGNYAAGLQTGALKGYINEVRIWNTARTQQEIKDNLFSFLPNPGSQPGLLAYYTFDNLLNKQGNSLYNGTLHGSASINNTVPNCSMVLDSCVAAVPVTITSFQATSPGNRFIQLNWHTEEETGIRNYIIERAVTVNGPFAPLTTVYAKNNSSNDYVLIDQSAKPNVNYFYRLAIIETTGSKKYSALKNAQIKTGKMYVNISPNPATQSINIQTGNIHGNAGIIICNNLGQVLITERTVHAGNTSINISRLPAGSYWLQVISEKEKLVKKFEKF